MILKFVRKYKLSKGIEYLSVEITRGYAKI